MISVVIPTLNAARGLPRTLASLWAANASGLIREVIVTDGGSSDETLAVADAAGCAVIEGEAGRGAQLARGAAAARGPWLLFLHADTALEGWEAGAAAFAASDDAAGVFPLAFSGAGRRARLVAGGANLRTRIARLPYGDRGLLISRARHDRVGGHDDLPLFEDVSLVRRIVREGGRGALRVLPGRAVTSPDRYEGGYARRVLRNQRCLLAYARGVPPAVIAEGYV